MSVTPGRLVLLGHPVSHSLSQRLQNAALRAAGISLPYEALDVPPEALSDVLTTLARVNAAGNVTIPHKERVFAACSRRTALAQRVGAVNVFWHEDGVLVGDNTDVGGFSTAATALIGAEPRDLNVGVIGAGGGAAAVLAAIEAWPGCRAFVSNRSAARALQLCARFSSFSQCGDVAQVVRDADLVVNATSVGLRNDDLPVPLSALNAHACVLDLVYRPGETAFVRAARASGRRAMDGLPMLVEQGALAFERWFDMAPDRDVMWRAVT